MMRPPVGLNIEAVTARAGSVRPIDGQIATAPNSRAIRAVSATSGASARARIRPRVAMSVRVACRT
ncbi:hypothetical protein D3C80_2205450 [compost metagenome]